MLVLYGRNFEYITAKEAHCHCGCGLVANEWLLTISNIYIKNIGSPTPITSLVRCLKHNHSLYKGDTTKYGYDGSPHLFNRDGFGAGDFGYRDKRKGSLMFMIAYGLFQAKIINHIEFCNWHIHIANVYEDSILAGLIQQGNSR